VGITGGTVKIIAELLAGIDPTTTDLVTTINEYWMLDEVGSVVLTGYHGDIAGNLWAVDGNDDYYPSGAGISELWEIAGDGSLVLK
jgi:hypothetical protein